MVSRAHLAASWAAATVLMWALPLPAQEAGRGWLGIRVQERYECVWETQEDWKHCKLVLSVREMQEDGPGASSGLHVDDQLVAIDGQDITFQNWTRLVTSIRSGRPVSVDVVRGGNRYVLRAIPTPRPANPDSIRMLGRATVTVRETGPRVFVFMLTQPAGTDRGAVAITIRETEDRGVSVEPSAVRVIDGQLRVLPLGDRTYPDLPDVRGEILGQLRQVTELSYQGATSALEAFDRVRARLPSSEFRRSIARIAQVEFDEGDLAIRFFRSFGGAEFEPVRRYAGRDGLLVLRIVPRTAAARVGLVPGDLVYRAGEIKLQEVQDLVEATSAGGPVPIRVYWIRGGREMSQFWPGG